MLKEVMGWVQLVGLGGVIFAAGRLVQTVRVLEERAKEHGDRIARLENTGPVRLVKRPPTRRDDD